MLESWRLKYLKKKVSVKEEYLPCPGSICHYSITLPQEEVVKQEHDGVNELKKDLHYP